MKKSRTDHVRESTPSCIRVTQCLINDLIINEYLKFTIIFYFVISLRQRGENNNNTDVKITVMWQLQYSNVFQRFIRLSFIFNQCLK